MVTWHCNCEGRLKRQFNVISTAHGRMVYMEHFGDLTRSASRSRQDFRFQDIRARQEAAMRTSRQHRHQNSVRHHPTGESGLCTKPEKLKKESAGSCRVTRQKSQSLSLHCSACIFYCLEVLYWPWIFGRVNQRHNVRRIVLQPACQCNQRVQLVLHRRVLYWPWVLASPVCEPG